MYTYHDIVRVLSSKTSFIMVDKILHFEPSQYIYALKNISLTDVGFYSKELTLLSAPLFIVNESMCQLSILFTELSGKRAVIEDIYIGSIEAKSFPGDTLGLELKVVKEAKESIVLQGQVLRDGQIVCSPRLTLKWEK